LLLRLICLIKQFAFGDQPPLFIQILHRLSDDGGPDPVHIDLARQVFARADQKSQERILGRVLAVPLVL
jgi:hypothetical protein